jgi:hypothetical protein
MVIAFSIGTSLQIYRDRVVVAVRRILLGLGHICCWLCIRLVTVRRVFLRMRGVGQAHGMDWRIISAALYIVFCFFIQLVFEEAGKKRLFQAFFFHNKIIGLVKKNKPDLVKGPGLALIRVYRIAASLQHAFQLLLYIILAV